MNWGEAKTAVAQWMIRAAEKGEIEKIIKAIDSIIMDNPAKPNESAIKCYLDDGIKPYVLGWVVRSTLDL